MKISLNWIKEYLPGLDFGSIESLTEKMISAGLDIEHTEIQSDIYKNFVVGEVLEKIKHPKADKLSLCRVNTGDKILNIVCGAPNMEAGQKVCVALMGAVIPDGGFEIKKSKIRGEISEGMICSDSELKLSEDHSGIKVLDSKALPGTKFSDYLNLNDIIFEIGITPNRGDLFSHFGIAREIAALFDTKIKIPEIILKESGTPTEELIKIKIEDEKLCRRFTGRVIKNVKITESPVWLKNRLISMGLRPRNSIVDITNFVMLETGQPLHAFDYDKIRGGQIIVKTANAGDKFITLDSKERILNENSLMVCDAEGYSGIAGVMGGEYSEITNETKNVFLESAYFDPVNIRLNSKNIGLKTDASVRFERGVDIDKVSYASERAAMLIQQIAGGDVSKDMLDVYPGKKDANFVSIRADKANELLGLNLNSNDLIKLLEKIEIEYAGENGNYLNFKIPEFRRLDLEREIDLIEEVARIYGYDNIKEDPVFSFDVSNISDYGKSERILNDEIANHLTGRGFNQIITKSLIDIEKLRETGNDDEVVRLRNSVSAGLDALRKEFTLEIFKVVRNNFFHSGKDISIKFFETGRTFRDSGDKFIEEEKLMIVLAGKKDVPVFYSGDSGFDLFDIKGEVEMLLSKLNLENYRLFYYNDNNFDGVRIDISLNDILIGTINKADSKTRKEFEIDCEVFYAEIFLDKIKEKLNLNKYYREISRFPAVKRDLAIVVKDEVNYDDLREHILRSGGGNLKSIELFDLYRDEKIGSDKKSLAFSLEFISNEKTLTDEETNGLMKGIITELETKFGARLRE